jgi:hypothetical protein
MHTTTFSIEVRLHHVLQDHALRVEIGSVQCDGVPHELQEFLAVSVKHRQDDLFEFLIKGFRVG